MSTLIILVLSFVLLFALNRYVLKNKFSLSKLGRVAMAIMLMITGITHFIKTAEMVEMIPDLFPFKILLVYATGVFEIAAAVGLLFERWSRISSIALITFFVLILPANIVGSLKRVELGGMENGPMYLFFRVPLQILFIWWTYYFGIYLVKPTAPKSSKIFSHN